MTDKQKYDQDFKTIADKLELQSFRDLFEAETGYEFNRARQAPCPFDNCASGKSGRKGSDGAFTYYPSLNIGKCHSCGQAAGNVKLLQILHGFSYKELIHYAGQKYFHTILENPAVNVKVKPSKRKLSEYVKPTAAEIKAEEEKRQKAFNYIKDLALKNGTKQAEEYLISRGEDLELQPKDSFFQLEAYKNKPAGVVFFDSEMKLLNQRYFKVPEGMNKQFNYGELKNSVYDHTFRKEYEQLFITEGTINARSIYQTNRSAIALFATTNFIDDVEKFKPYFEGKDVVIAFDFDKHYAGQKSAVKQAFFIMMNFKVHSLSILMFPEDKDANDLLQSNELDAFLANKFNYAFPSLDKITEMKIEIRKNYKGYKPELKPENYFTRPAVPKKEPDGHFEFKKFDKIPQEIINRFKGSEEICEQTFLEAGLICVNEYTIVSGKTAHTHVSVIDNPIFKTKYGKHIIRPFAKKPYKKIESYEETLTEFGKGTIIDLYEINKTEMDEDAAKLHRATIVYNFIDFINVKAVGEHPVYISGKLSYDLRTDLLMYCREIYQIPGNNTFEKGLANSTALKNINVKTFELPAWCKSITHYLSEKKSYVYKNQMNTALPLKFWSFNTEKNLFNLNVIILRNFLTKFGYFTYQSEFGPQDYSYIKINGRIVEKIDKDSFPRHIETFIDEYLRNRGESVETRNKISVSNRFSEKNLSGLKQIELDFDNSAVDFQNFFFSDGNMWTVTKNGITKKSQRSLKKYVWEEELLEYPSEIIEPPFKISITEEWKNADAKKRKGLRHIDKYDIEIKDRNNYFLQYLFATSYSFFEKAESKGYFVKPSDFWYELPEATLTEDEIKEIKLHLINKITWLGYYMKDYRSPNDQSGLAILDAVEDLPGNRRRGAAGGGKSLITRGIKEVKRTLIIKADREDFAEYAHRYENYNGERVIVCDDMNLKSRLGNMLTDFSNGIDVNRKHKSVVPIPFHRSPKIIVTRNYVDDEGERVDRRLGRMFVFPFFHDNKSGRFKTRREPADWFGRMLYDGDSYEDKKNLINFFAYAYKTYMNLGQVNPPMMDMTKFRLSKRIGEPLLDFLDTYFEQEENFGYIERVPFFNSFKNEKRGEMDSYQRTRVYSSSQKLKALVEDYCTLRDYVFNPPEFLTDKKKTRIRKQNEENKSTEHLYIAPKEKFFKDLDGFNDVEDLPEEYSQTEVDF